MPLKTDQEYRWRLRTSCSTTRPTAPPAITGEAARRFLGGDVDGPVAAAEDFEPDNQNVDDILLGCVAFSLHSLAASIDRPRRLPSAMCKEVSVANSSSYRLTQPLRERRLWRSAKVGNGAIEAMPASPVQQLPALVKRLGWGRLRPLDFDRFNDHSWRQT
ncbi:MAG: hypothetical protein EOR16_23495 [Mesorhizobium sp.]|uniref:hypothetical protein n=1 Tax=Mesorhizobium sp. TaxID=1871066 RepID=UPI000FE483B3|nr:hypothetical protein [Mesorhizobium sp.]RWI54751.1 MAG: hypothetical protein EOR16_23495 [Mesorhizobium sp.]